MALIDRLLHMMVERGASDLHMTCKEPPILRVDGTMQRIEGDPPLDYEMMTTLLKEIAPPHNWEEFQKFRDTDFAYALPGLARFRANYFCDLAGPGAVFRQIPAKILTAKDLNLPSAILDLCFLSKGLVLVTGPTGSGKSTTLAAMVDHINKNRKDHIITIEDPVEFVHQNHSCLINQREVGTHTMSFKKALRAALREDPDIILVGEMRDLETVHIALEMAETGHLVFGTLHTTTAASTVDRLIDQFPSEQQAQIRTMLAESLKGVIAQTLLKRASGKGRIAALEILLVNNAVSANIREGKTHQIPLAMQTGRSAGMIELNTALMNLVQSGTVKPEEAYAKSVDRGRFKEELKRAGITVQMPGEEGKPKPRPGPPGQGRPQRPPAGARPPRQAPPQDAKKKGWFG